VRAEAALALLLLAVPALRAQDLGAYVHFGARRGADFAVSARPGGGARVLFDSGLSDPIPGDWDTILIQGVMPDPGVHFQALRPDVPTVWVELQVKRFPDGRFWAKARFQRGFGRVRLRAVDAGVTTDHEMSVFAVEVFEDAPALPSAPVPPSRGPVDPSAVPPRVHARAQWRAEQPINPYTPDPVPWRVTLHHTDGRFTANLAQSLDEARFIQDFHQHGRGWNDIGYHFLIDRLGNILEGRPLQTLGAHTLSNNEGNVGIALLGTYHAPRNDAATPAQLAAVGALGRFLVKRFGLDPVSLKGHRDYKQTDCPGDLAYPKLAELRAAFAQRASRSAASPSATR
jgi:hypothetical protein